MHIQYIDKDIFYFLGLLHSLSNFKILLLYFLKIN